MLPLFAAEVLANGQSVHVWITVQATDALPDGDLRAFLADPEVRDALITGAMFPDGGYPLGDPYGEAAHWEPFRDAWMRHVLDVCGTSGWDLECKKRVAFLFGLASHGIADPFYDAAYMNRAEHAYDVDADWSISMDQATDVVFVADHGPVPTEPRWLPGDELAGAFAEVGVTVDADRLNEGQGLLEIAVAYVGLAAQQPDTVAEYRADFPWGCAHLDDGPGRPAEEALAVAAYWERLWMRLHGEPDTDPPLIYAVGLTGEHPESTIEARVTLVFARGLDADPVEAAPWLAEDANADEWPLQADVYYGDWSQVVNLDPADGLGVDLEHTIAWSPLPTWTGEQLAGGEVSFTTAPAPPPPERSCASVGGSSGAATSWMSLGWVSAAALISAKRRRLAS